MTPLVVGGALVLDYFREGDTLCGTCPTQRLYNAQIGRDLLVLRLRRARARGLRSKHFEITPFGL